MTASADPSENALTWRRRRGGVALGRDEIHVWRLWLERAEAGLAALTPLLSGDERRRAERYRFDRDRRRFVAARGLARVVLGDYLRRSPASLRFDLGAHGKPSLRGERELRFNVSHSGGVALLAVSRGPEVGVDVERIEPSVPAEELAERVFSPREREALRAVPPGRRSEAFFAGWCRKEAYIKARGLGLSLELRDFDVSLDPGEPAALLATRDDPSHAARWSLRDLPPTPGYAAAVAAEGRAWRLWCGEWEPGPAG